ncbi:MAG: hypothetical protein JW775_01310, partial [Candidatus Aminicenantes bacterium]|nr:hypothetical protein [Candidatus Aminicenantes bacterium]
MARKISALFALAAFSIFDLGCIPLRPNPSPRGRAALDPADLGPQASELKIVGAVLKTGTYISFDEKQPARVTPGGDAVVGLSHQTLEIADDAVKNVILGPKGEILEIETEDGRAYKITSATPVGDRTRYRAFGPITLPLSDIQQVWIKTSKRGGASALTYVAVAGLAAAMVFLVIAVSNQEPDPTPPGPIIPESCPFVYSWNGKGYVLDAEPYGAAVTEGLKRTDWIELSELRPSAGVYRLLLANELDETQYTDELKLVAVDHAPGRKVAADH